MNYQVQPLSTLKSSLNVTAIIPEIRRNTNNYPYITVLKGKDKEGKAIAENIYLTKSQSDVTEFTAEWFKGLNVIHTTNAQGQPRIKLGKGAALDIDDLLG